MSSLPAICRCVVKLHRGTFVFFFFFFKESSRSHGASCLRPFIANRFLPSGLPPAAALAACMNLSTTDRLLRAAAARTDQRQGVPAAHLRAGIRATPTTFAPCGDGLAARRAGPREPLPLRMRPAGGPTVLQRRHPPRAARQQRRAGAASSVGYGGTSRASTSRGWEVTPAL